MSIRKWKDLGSDPSKIKQALVALGVDFDLEIKGGAKPDVIILRKGEHEVRFGQTYGLDVCLREPLKHEKVVLKGKLGTGDAALPIEEHFDDEDAAQKRKNALEESHRDAELDYAREEVPIRA